MRRQKAVYWKRLQPDRHGNFDYDHPVEIDCRWVDQQGTFRNSDGEEMNARSRVFVDRQMAVGDKLMLGEMESDVPIDPTGVPGASEIVLTKTTPNFNNTEMLYEVNL